MPAYQRQGRLKHNVRKEIRYARGMQAMHRERYLEYCLDLRVAQQSGDMQRAKQIADDLRAFVGEMWYLVDKEQSAYQRLAAIISQTGKARQRVVSHNTAPPEGEEPTTPIRLVLTRPQDT